MRLKIAAITMLSALGLFASTAAHADPYRRTTVARPPARVERVHRDRHYGRPVVYAPTVTVAQPVVYTQPVYTYGENPALFAQQIHAEEAQAINDIQYHVQAGTLSPDALRAMQADQDEIERDLAEASQKGYITDADRAHLEQHIQELRDLRTQYAMNTANCG